jgi:outer membrane lipoprotein
MHGRRFAAALAITVAAWSGGGCIPQYVVPEPLESQINRTVGFAELKQDAERHKGASVVLGGAVLNARILQEGTQIEVLQLPLDAADRPDAPFEASEGRFLLIDPGRRDPAVLRDRRITVVGEVVGTKVQTVDEFEYAFPYLSVRFIHVWGSVSEDTYGLPYPYPYPDYSPYYYSYPFSYYPFLSLGLYPFWYGSSWYYPYHDLSIPAPSRRRFEAPPLGHVPSAPQQPPPPSTNGGLRRRF